MQDIVTTPETSGASKKACDITNAIAQFDAFAQLRHAEETENTGFFAHVARTVDRELKDTSSADGND